MKMYVINGSPRKMNTVEILDKVVEGAREACPGIEVERVDLYKLKYKGCIACYQCKLIGGPSYGKCAVKDDIHELLQDVLHADIAVFGSPIFMGIQTGEMHCFQERLFWPCFVYSKPLSTIAPKKVHTAFIYTMCDTKEEMEKKKYPEALKHMEDYAAFVFSIAPRVQYVNFTYQFRDYSKYMFEYYTEAEQGEHRKKQFPIDCEHARELGKALVADVRTEKAE